MSSSRDPQLRAPVEALPQIRAICERVLSPVRAAAERCGYAIGAHGSMTHDCDLIAAPWTSDAVGAGDLIEAIRAAIAHELGDCFSTADVGHKPHGRIVFTLITSKGVRGPWGCLPFFDISVMPRAARGPA